MCDPQDAGEIICARELRARVRESGGCRRAGCSSDLRTRERGTLRARQLDVTFHVSWKSLCQPRRRSRGHGFSDERRSRLLVSKSALARLLPSFSLSFSIFLNGRTSPSKLDEQVQTRRNKIREPNCELSSTRKREGEGERANVIVYLEGYTKRILHDRRWPVGVVE